MANSLKIKISIADRVYPLTIMPEQEEGLRKAAKTRDQLIKEFEKSYAVRDKQDVLVMCALQIESQVEQKSIDKDMTNEQTKGRLKKGYELLANQW